MVLTPEEVRHVAMLARLGLSDEEIETMRGQLDDVLNYIAMLEKVDTSQVEPTAQVLTHLNITRGDEPRPSWPTGRLLSGAPASEDAFFRVPPVFDEFKAGDSASGAKEAGDE